MSKDNVSVSELEPVVISDDGQTCSAAKTQKLDQSDDKNRSKLSNDGGPQNDVLRSFLLSLNGVAVELCSLGASISKVLVPSCRSGPVSTSASASVSTRNSDLVDDIVLGYKSPLTMYKSNNPPYFGVIVGRVANRIAKGSFKLPVDNDENNNKEALQTYQLATNNGPNHLHGGLLGFSHRNWDSKIIVDGENNNKGVEFTLLSEDGDQGYPGSVLATVTYTLVASESSGSNNENVSSNADSVFAAATIRVTMNAKLISDDKKMMKPTPISLAQHSYFNLAGHDAKNGILDHIVSLNCEAYTPTDETSIPTRQVVLVKDDPTMNFLPPGKCLRDALTAFGVAKACISSDEAAYNVNNLSRCKPDIAKSTSTGGNLIGIAPGEPYGFDHNFVVKQQDQSPSSSSGTSEPQSQKQLNLVGTVIHEQTKRTLTVRSNTPGVQFYTSNYLDGSSIDPQYCKESAIYCQWQGLCLETQHFPDSIMLPEETQLYPEFEKGKCTILQPGDTRQNHYEHIVEYCIQCMR